MSAISNHNIPIFPRSIDVITPEVFVEGMSIDIARIHVEANEFDPSKETLILLHGYLGTHDDFNPVIEEFFETHNIIAMDLRGHGASEVPENYGWTIHDLAFDVLQAIEAFVPSGHKVNIVASSLATAIAMEFTKEFPDYVDKLMLISPTHKFSMNILQKMLVKLGSLSPDKFALAFVEFLNWVWPIFILDKQAKQITLQGFENVKSMEPIVHRKIMEETLASWELDPSDIGNKTLILAGESDKVVSFEDSVKLNEILAHSSLIPIPKMKHLIIRKRPEVVIKLLHLWLDTPDMFLEKDMHSLDEFID